MIANCLTAGLPGYKVNEDVRWWSFAFWNKGDLYWLS